VSLREDRVGSAEGREAGAITVDNRTTTVAPLEVDLDVGGAWRAFPAMLTLGGHHIADGTDHLLFLLTLLLPAPLPHAGRHRRRPGRRRPTRRERRSPGHGGVRRRHSVTLALGALGRFELPAGPVEALIAAGILVSAVRAVRPVFPGQEALVAGGSAWCAGWRSPSPWPS
jgi:hypothetical protein